MAFSLPIITTVFFRFRNILDKIYQKLLSSIISGRRTIAKIIVVAVYYMSDSVDVYLQFVDLYLLKLVFNNLDFNEV